MPPNRGALVRELSEGEVIEVFEMRAVLEGLAAAMAAKRYVQADVDDLVDLLSKMKRCGPDLSGWITAHRRFHERFCAISGAHRLMEQISSLHSIVEPLMRIWLENNNPSPFLQEHHEQLLTSLQSGDPDKLEREMRSHVRETAESIAEAMRQNLLAGAKPRRAA